MDKILYFFGSGFSAPLGFTTTSNFLSRAKDIYYDDPGKFEHFEKVIKVVNSMSVIKNYYEADMFNVEEILSVLEMSDELKSKNTRPLFTKFIVDVINASMPYLGLTRH